jgi:cyclopropane fatty-acyl-phospholipid synthase-like methyltransferase
MNEDKRGLKRIISKPAIYNLVQLLAGARMYRNRMVRDYIKPFKGCRILDIGCGTGEYVEFLDRHCDAYEYFGFDGEAGYIAYAQRLFAHRPGIRFHHRILTEDRSSEFKNFDIVMAIGVMHHMGDDLVLSLLRAAKMALSPGGRLITYDPGQFSDMNAIEGFFVKHDRGRNIRFVQDYERLVGQAFQRYTSYVPRLTYYPCRNVIFECFNAE